MSRLIKIKPSMSQTSFACPSIFEFEDIYGDHYYFRLRHGYWRLMNETKDECIASGDTKALNLDGSCSWDEATLLCASEQVFVIMDYCYDDEDEDE